MEAAIKLCRQYWVEKGESQRKYIIARFPSYHGNTLGALAVSYDMAPHSVRDTDRSDCSLITADWQCAFATRHLLSLDL